MRLTGLTGKLLLAAGSLVFTLVLLELVLQVAALFVRPGRVEAGAPPVDGEYRVICLGESTTHGFGALPYPKILEDEINQRDLGVRFRVINAGLLGQHSPYLATRLEALVDQHDPHMVIVMMGINDEFYFSTTRRFTIPIRLQLALLELRTYKLARLIHHALTAPEVSSAAAIPAREQSDEVVEFNRLSILYADPDYWAAHRDVDRGLRALIRQARQAPAPPGTRDEVLGIDEAYRFHYYTAYTTLTRVYLERGQRDAAEALLLEAIARHPDSPFFHRGLAGLYEDLGEPGRAAPFARRAAELEADKVRPVTKASYQRIERFLRDRGIVLVAMQYPLRSVSALEYMLDGSEYPFYVDNDETFRAALRTSSYQDLFFDRFAGDIGHCTAAGNRLIAENLITAVFEPLFAGRAAR